ncbi:MAG: tRNA-dihydrouridine synthase family protein [Candidatus Diapherotrites archaeon]|uniref:tRNA-dihydrouridine synthase family protein n=1 Tax=Candidatus Iainarchaeum sp. TaxID=3101447 RepID=A0A7K4BZC5_9ARCH|nr:tRNA-dihydrouridine synthase family protein [Candidatus Diapherotrites archaeon]
MFRYMVAPLENFSGPAFRSLCYKHGADVTFTEMTRVEGILRNNKSTLSKLIFPDSTPVEIQLLPGDEAQLDSYLGSFKNFEGFVGFNLNMGCPSVGIIKSGRGAGMVKRLSKVDRLAKIMRLHQFPFSIKLRLGGTEFEKKHKVYLRILQNIDTDYFILNPKHGMQESGESEDDSVYPECVDICNSRGIPLIANGGINSIKKVKELEKIGISGVMIGRAAITNPSIFDSLKGKKASNKTEITKEYKELSEKFKENEKYFKNYLNWKK